MAAQVVDGDENYNKEYRRLRTLTSREDILKVSVSVALFPWKLFNNIGFILVCVTGVTLVSPTDTVLPESDELISFYLSAIC